MSVEIGSASALRFVPLDGNFAEEMLRRLLRRALACCSFRAGVTPLIQRFASSVSLPSRLGKIDVWISTERERLLLPCEEIFETPETPASCRDLKIQTLVVEELVVSLFRFRVSYQSVVQSHWGRFQIGWGRLSKIYPKIPRVGRDGPRCVETLSGKFSIATSSG